MPQSIPIDKYVGISGPRILTVEEHKTVDFFLSCSPTQVYEGFCYFTAAMNHMCSGCQNLGLGCSVNPIKHTKRNVHHLVFEACYTCARFNRECSLANPPPGHVYTFRGRKLLLVPESEVHPDRIRALAKVDSNENLHLDPHFIAFKRKREDEMDRDPSSLKTPFRGLTLRPRVLLSSDEQTLWSVYLDAGMARTYQTIHVSSKKLGIHNQKLAQLIPLDMRVLRAVLIRGSMAPAPKEPNGKHPIDRYAHYIKEGITACTQGGKWAWPLPDGWTRKAVVEREKSDKYRVLPLLLERFAVNE